MIQCSECEFFTRGRDGTPRMNCDPFSTIKEPECLAKWQLVQLMVISRSHQSTFELNQRMAPLQEKMFRHIEREIDEVEDADSWKREQDDEDDDNSFKV